MLLNILQNSQENTSVFFFIKSQVSACKFIKKETLIQVFFSEFCKSFKSNFFTEHLRMTASATAKVSSHLTNQCFDFVEIKCFLFTHT